jgi:RHS repeat-associated protein
VGATNGTGGDTATFSYDANDSGAERAVEVPIAGRTVTVTQITPNQAPSEDMVYYHMDAIGSVRMVSDANGEKLRTHDFLPFGQDTPAGTNGTESFLFAGHERDAYAASDYFEARFCAPFAERFTSPDPIAVAADRILRPDLLNRYTYANNNPLSFVDPDGMKSACVTDTSTCVVAKKKRVPTIPPNVPLIVVIDGCAAPASLRDPGAYCERYGKGFSPADPGDLPSSGPMGDPQQQCFAQLKSRAVMKAGKRIGDHAFWYIQGRDGRQRLLSAAHDGAFLGLTGGYLNSSPGQGLHNAAGDYVEATTYWDSGLSTGNCDGVQAMINAASSYPQNGVPYWLPARTSNTYAHWLGIVGGFSASQPNLWNVGWDYVGPYQSSPKAAVVHFP